MYAAWFGICYVYITDYVAQVSELRKHLHQIVLCSVQYKILSKGYYMAMQQINTTYAVLIILCNKLLNKFQDN